MGELIEEFRNTRPPEFTGIAGDFAKGIIDGFLDGANFIRNVVFDQKNYDGLYPRMTGWDGNTLGGQEGQDRSIGGIISLGGLMTGGLAGGGDAAKEVGRIQASSLKEFKSLVQSLSKYGSEVNQSELQQLEKLAEKFGGKLRYDLNPVKGKVLKPHVQVEKLGTSVEGRKIWLAPGVK